MKVTADWEVIAVSPEVKGTYVTAREKGTDTVHVFGIRNSPFGVVFLDGLKKGDMFRATLERISSWTPSSA